MSKTAVSGYQRHGALQPHGWVTAAAGGGAPAKFVAPLCLSLTLVAEDEHFPLPFHGPRSLHMGSLGPR